MGGGRKKSGWGVSWTTSELSASTPTSGRLQPRTRRSGAERRNKRRNISWRNESLQRKPGLGYSMQSYARTWREGPRRGYPKASGLVLVRSPLLTSHKWCDLIYSGRLVCRCHDVFLWCYVCFVLLHFRLYAFVEAAVLRSPLLRYPGAPIPHVFLFSFHLLFTWRCRFFQFCFVPLPFSLCMESTSYVFSFQMVFFYLVTTGWIFGISLCENSINHQITVGFSPKLCCFIHVW